MKNLITSHEWERAKSVGYNPGKWPVIPPETTVTALELAEAIRQMKFLSRMEMATCLGVLGYAIEHIKENKS